MEAEMDGDPYSGISDLYDHVVPYRERADISFFVEEAKMSGGPVLELGCGTGRVLIPTARAGLTITGVDRSVGMLNECRERLRSEPEDVMNRVRLVNADMRSLSLSETYRLVTLPFRPFQHLLSVDDQLSALKAIRRHLAPGGRLILDLFNPSFEALLHDPVGREFGDEPPFETPDGRRVIRRQKIVNKDFALQVVHVDLIYHITHPSGRLETRTHAAAMRYFFRYEVVHLLARCGFVVRELFADYDRTPYGKKYPGELIFLAEGVEEE